MFYITGWIFIVCRLYDYGLRELRSRLVIQTMCCTFIDNVMKVCETLM